MANNGSEFSKTIDLLRKARGAPPPAVYGPHLTPEVLVAFAEGDVSPESVAEIGHHLYSCARCRELALALDWSAEAGAPVEAERTGRAERRGLVIPLRGLRRLGTPIADPTGLRMVAADRPGVAGGEAVLEHLDVRAAVTEGVGGELMVTVQRRGEAVTGVVAVLEEVSDTGECTEVARAITDASGDATLGRLDAFPPPRVGWAYDVRIDLPGTQGA